MAYPIITVKESSTEIEVRRSQNPKDYFTIKLPEDFKVKGSKGQLLKGSNPKELFDCHEGGEIEIESG